MLVGMNITADCDRNHANTARNQNLVLNMSTKLQCHPSGKKEHGSSLLHILFIQTN